MRPLNVLIGANGAGKSNLISMFRSDGTIRFLCLLASLLQPNLPTLLVLDEPEIGLHPEAIGLLASLLRSASHQTQIVLSTQEPTLVSEFDPADVAIVENRNGCSIFKRLDQEELAIWLSDYSLGQLWQKGVLDATADDRAPSDRVGAPEAGV